MTFSDYEYFKKMDKEIYNILKSPEKDNLTYDILDTEKTKRYKLTALKEKQRHMKIGKIWQVIIGNYNRYIDLGNNHKSGLDILSYEMKIAIELKNRTNTDNSSSRKTNFDKLSKFKKFHPEYKVIYATINDNTENSTYRGCIKKIIHNNVEIEHYTGLKFLKLIFKNDTNKIITFVRNTIDNYS